ncbi:RICIN domain-containing protein [Streptomyces sp. NPDC052236]|uniref:RICIN domain-containing protein n=1 Tax=Streptomyces sp. NPDC052236 TaxID=3365686 RepID=UPI0037D1B0E7
MGKFGRIAAALAASASMLTGGLLATATHASADDGYNYIHNREIPGQVWDADDHGTDPGTAVVTYDINGGDNQQWSITNVGGGFFTIKGKESGLCASAQQVGGASVTLQDCNNLRAQWRHVPLEGDYVLLQNRVRGTCATLMARNAPLGLETCDPDDTFQHWKVAST